MVRRKVLVCLFVLGTLLLGATQAGALLPPDEDPGGGGDGGGGGGSEIDDLDWAPAIANVAMTSPFTVTTTANVIPPLPDLRHRGPFGIWEPNCANDFCLPDLPVVAPFCMDPVNVPGDYMTRNGVRYGYIARSCYQLQLSVAFQAATGVDPNPIEFTLQQFQRNIHQECNEQFPYASVNKYKCYIASGVAKEKARPLVQANYGHIAVPGFNAPILIDPIPPLPHPVSIPGGYATQPSHAFIATCGWGGASPCHSVPWGSTFGPGARLYLTGVVHPGRKMIFIFRDPDSGDVLDWWITAEARDNGVVHHEREEFYLDRIRRGRIRLEARYLRWEGNSPGFEVIGEFNLVAGNTGGGGGGGGGGCEPELPEQAVRLARSIQPC